MKTQEDRIEEALNSINSIQRATMPELLGNKIMLQLEGITPRVIAIPKRNIWLMAAGVALLAGLNFYTLISAPEKSHTEMTADSRNPVGTEYFTPMPTI